MASDDEQTEPRSSRLGGRGGARAALVGCLALACAAPVYVAPPDPSPAPYTVHHPDELLVQISPEPELEVETTVRPDGMISIVLIGDVRAEGLTPEQIARRIESLMGEYRLFPVVTVSVLEARSPTITVLGEVEAPGRIPLDRSTRLAEAIAMAGGTTQLAAESRVRIVRREADVSRTYLANLEEIRAGDQATNALLQDGDLVMVPPATPVGVGYGLRRALYPLEVVVGVFSRAVFFFLY